MQEAEDIDLMTVLGYRNRTVLAVKQRDRQAREYVQDFRRAAGRVPACPEHMLVHLGLPARLQDWYSAVTELDSGLCHLKIWSDLGAGQRRGPPINQVLPGRSTTFKCYHCNQPGHRAAECPITPLQVETQSPQGTLNRGFGGSVGHSRWSPKCSQAAAIGQIDVSTASDLSVEEVIPTAKKPDTQEDDGEESNMDDPNPAYPIEYTDLADVFNKTGNDQILPHRPTDCAIELIPGVKLPKPYMYSMTPQEMHKMWK
ncbi:hypothetical protein E2320_001858 [Naja naja]|nr:hypothetical protein E2320_001858 [Naja naja]